jgi:guanylate kinase
MKKSGKLEHRENPLVVVISGPSGVGKDATIAGVTEAEACFHYVVTATTRPMRAGEVDGVDYYFFSRADFLKNLEKGEFIEYAEVYGNYYGVLKKEIHNALHKGEDVILKVDVQGAATLKKKIPDAVFIFLMPPSIKELTERLKKRNADSSTDIDLRINKAEGEIGSLAMFDYKVVNYKDNLKRTADVIRAIVIAEKCRVRPRIVKL